MWVGFVAYLGILLAAPTLGRRVVWGAIVRPRGRPSPLTPVLLSHDVYSYVDYARLGARPRPRPLRPRAARRPERPGLRPRHLDRNDQRLRPLFTLATYPLAWLSVPTAVAVAEGGRGALASSASPLVVARLAAWRGVDPLRAAAFVALNPLVLVHVVGGAHNDALTMLLVMLAVAGDPQRPRGHRRSGPRGRGGDQGLRRSSSPPSPCSPPQNAGRWADMSTVRRLIGPSAGCWPGPWLRLR